MDMNMDVKDLFAALKKKSGSKKKDTRGKFRTEKCKVTLYIFFAS